MSSLRGATTAVSRLARHLIDFVYPPVCQVCRNGFVSTDSNIWFCGACQQKLQSLPAPYCPICRNSLIETDSKCRNCRRESYLSWQYSLGIYDESLSHLIKACKYSDKPGIASMLGRMLADQMKEFNQADSIDLVCAIPIHPRKLAVRGFNQSELIAEALANQLSIEHAPGLLFQSRRNRDQIGLNVGGRYQNVRDVFALSDPAFVKEKTVLVIDDVTTSGATLNSVAHLLSDSGAAAVAAATVAMALEDGLSPELLYSMMWEDF